MVCLLLWNLSSTKPTITLSKLCQNEAVSFAASLWQKQTEQNELSED